METVLMIVTVIALALAIAMAVLAWRLLRENRERSEARAQALQALVSEDDARFASVDAESPAPDVLLSDLEPAEEDDDLDIRPTPKGADWDWALAESRRVPLEPAVLSRTVQRDPASNRMFAASTAQPRAPRNSWVAVGAVATVVAVLGAGIYVVYGPGLGVETPLAALSNAATPGANRPLELLSLRHTTDSNGTFNVTGLVKNPSGGGTVRNVVAVVYVFDREGNYFSGGKAALDFPALQAGAESPFVVRVPGVSHVSRYRVGFRTEDNGVVAHVDRRGQAPDGIMVETR